MIKSITVVNPRNESLKLTLKNPIASGGIAVLGVTGLGPTKAEVNTTVISTMDGVRVNSVRAGSRNVVLTLAFVGNDVETIRQKTYRYFPIKKKVSLVIETDNRTLETSGVVESNEPDIFSKQEGSTISIVCGDAYLRASDNFGLTVTEYYEIYPQFEFPFENNPLSGSLTEKDIIFGQIETYQSQDVHYWGEVETGLTFHILALDTATNVSVSNPETGQTITIDSAKLATLTGSGIVSGDELLISTIKGQKAVKLIRGGVEYNIMNALAANTSWVQLTPGENIITYSADSGAGNLRLTVIHQPLFEGV